MVNKLGAAIVAAAAWSDGPGLVGRLDPLIAAHRGEVAVMVKHLGTGEMFAHRPDEPMATLWIGMLAFFDVVFVTLSLWTFEPLMNE